MKAIFLVKNGKPSLAFEERETPTPLPSAEQILIKVEAFGLNYADVMARLGMYQDAPKMPCVLGYEVVGTVHQIGEDVRDIFVGQRVLAMTRFGGYAEFAVTDYRACVVVKEEAPAGELLALATQYSTAYYAACEMTTLHPNDTVLIHAAAGGVGTALVQIAKQKGCTIFGTAGSDAKLEYLRQQGVQFPINYQTTEWEDIVKKELGGKGLDVIFDSLGGKYIKNGIKALGSGGRIVSYGAAEMSAHQKNSIVQTLKTALGFGFYSPISFLTRSKSLIGVNMLRIADDRPFVLQRVMKAVVSGYENGDFRPHIGGTFAVNKIAEAHELLSSRQSMGKIQVVW